MDRNLTSSEKAQSAAFKALLEEHLYFIGVYFRWVDDPGWATVNKEFFNDIPFILRPFLKKFIRNSVKKALYSQGIARHSRDEILALGYAALKSLSDFLGSKPFLMGNQMTIVDTAFYGTLSFVGRAPVETPLKGSMMTFNNLVQYCERVEDLIFQEFKK